MSLQLADAEQDWMRARLVCALVAFSAGLEPLALEQPRKSRRAAMSRRIAMYLLHVAYGYSLARVAQAFRCDRSTAGYACRWVEELRDDPAFNTRMDALEDTLRVAPAPASGGERRRGALQ